MKIYNSILFLFFVFILISCGNKKDEKVAEVGPTTGLQKIPFKESILFYDSANVTKYDANKLVEYLDKHQINEGNIFILNKSGKTFEFKIIIKKGLEQDQETITAMKLLAASISNDAFNGSPVDIHLCDDKFNLIRVVLQADYVPKTTETPKRDYSNYKNGKYSYASERYLTASELAGFNKYELKIMRNEIFARHGYIFQTDDMRKYFYYEKWYTPTYTDVNSMLTPLEKTRNTRC